LAEVRVPVGARPLRVAGVVGVHEVDAAGDGLDALGQAGQFLAAGPGVAGVEAEADVLGALGRADRVPESGDAFDAAGHGPVAPPGVLDEHREFRVETLDALAPVVEADLEIFAGAHVAAVHDDPGRTDLGGGVDLDLQALAARDADAVVRARGVEVARSVPVAG